jgi:hypothetical protein
VSCEAISCVIVAIAAQSRGMSTPFVSGFLKFEPEAEHGTAARSYRHNTMLPREWEFAIRRIIQANIDRLKVLLKTETDPTKRATEARLLAKEEAKQKQLPAQDKKETKAY